MPPRSRPVVPADLEIYLPTPHSGQKIVEEQAEGKRVCVLLAGRRWRKTTLIIPRCLKKAIQGHECLIAAPVFSPHLTILWREAEKALRKLIELKLCTLHVGNMTITFEGLGLGNILWFRSLEEPDNARGPSAKYIFVDEAGLVGRGEEALNEVLRPMLLDHEDGQITLSGTPKGRNWFADEYYACKRAMDSGVAESTMAAWQIPSLGCEITDDRRLVRKPHPLENPHLSWDVVMEDFLRMPERSFRQEILAEIIETQGAVFHEVDRAIRKGDVNDEEPFIRYDYQIGADIARIHDFTVLSCFRRHDMRQVAIKRFNQVSWPRIYNEIAMMSRKYNNAMVFVDATAANTVIGELNRRGVPNTPIVFNNANKRAMCDHLAAEMEHCAEPFLMDHAQQRAELLAFEYDETASGAIRMRAPKGESKFDDCVIAAALGTNGLNAARVGEEARLQQAPIVGKPSEFSGTFRW